MKLDPDHCYAAIRARDARFDGLFFVGVTTTGIYCRPICGVRTPGRDRCRFFGNAASAEASGFRPCLRCRPELAPGAAPSDAVHRVATAAVARIEAGDIADGSIEALAASFSISTRQLRRVIEREYGVTPVALAQTRRLLMAKQLLTDTPLKIAEVAYASGFSSLRRFNHLFRSRYGLQPSALRRRALPTGEAGTITLKLGYRPPLAWSALAGFLAARGTPRVERLHGTQYLRSLKLGDCQGWLLASPDARGNVIRIEVSPSLLPVLTQLRERLRRLFDLDANPAVIEVQLGRDRRLAPLLRRRPGLRVPGSIDGFELALRAIIGQQISVKAATTVFGRFVEHFGEAVSTPFAGLDRCMPTAAAIAMATPQQIIDRGLTRQRAHSLRMLARAVADGLTLAPGAAPAQTLTQLAALPGIGPWTTQYIGMRALGYPDAFPAGDLALRKALDARSAAALTTRAEAWRPWRAYAAMHLWHSLAAGG